MALAPWRLVMKPRAQSRINVLALAAAGAEISASFPVTDKLTFTLPVVML